MELVWLDEHVGDKPYGVDIVIPGKYEGMGEMDPVKLEAQLQSMVPDDHRRFARRLLADHGVPEPPEDQRRSGMMGWTEATGKPLLAAALRHDMVKLIANALGTPPADVIAQVKASGRLIGALAGSVKHAMSHKEAGLDFIVCQGTEGGGHTGDVASLVLWPEVIDAVAPLPVLAAGGVGSGRQIAAALAMGAQGVWGGTLWLTVEEADTAPGQMKSYLAATSRDTVRSKSFTGKPCRMLKNDWTEAWDRPETPDPLPMPLQMMVAIEAVGATPALPRGGEGRRLQPVRAGHRAGHPRAQDARRRLRPRRGVRRSRRAPVTDCQSGGVNVALPPMRRPKITPSSRRSLRRCHCWSHWDTWCRSTGRSCRGHR